MKVVTVATQCEDLFPVLQGQCQKLGLELVVLGWGQKWRGFSWRWTLLEAYLKTLPPEEIVVWCDAYDVIPIAPAHVIEARFKEFDKPLVFSVEEEHVSLRIQYIRERMFGSCNSNAHLNGGLYIGRVWAIVQMISVLRTEFGFKDADDDQQILNKLCKTDFFREHAGLDRESRIMKNLHPDRLGPYPYPYELNTCFLHGPGPLDMTEIALYYGYRVESPAVVRYSIRFFKHSAKWLWPEYLVSFLTVILLLVALYKVATLRR